MAWESRRGIGRYYTRSRRKNGRVIREYCGIGDKGEAAAAVDQQQRLARQQAKNYLVHLIAHGTRSHRALDEVERIGNRYLEAILAGAGYHLHRNTEWRERRDH